MKESISFITLFHLRIFEVRRVFRLFPVEQILEIVDEGFLLQMSSLSEKVKIVRIRQTLSKLKRHSLYHIMQAISFRDLYIERYR